MLVSKAFHNSKGIKCTHKYQDKEWKRVMITSIGRFWMYSYWDQ